MDDAGEHARRARELVIRADNLLKNAAAARDPGSAVDRARRAYRAALQLAEAAGDTRLAGQIRLRLADLAGRGEAWPGRRGGIPAAQPCEGGGVEQEDGEPQQQGQHGDGGGRRPAPEEAGGAGEGKACHREDRAREDGPGMGEPARPDHAEGQQP